MRATIPVRTFKAPEGVNPLPAVELVRHPAAPAGWRPARAPGLL